MLNGYVRSMRLKGCLGFSLFAILGFILAQGYSASILNILAFSMMIFLYLAFSFSINACFDIKEDKLKGTKKNPIATGDLSFRNALFFSIALPIIGVIISTFFGYKVFGFYVALTILSFFYSSPPIRLKSRFILDIASHGLFFGSMLFVFPFIFFNANITLFHYLIAFSLFYLSIILELRNHIKDYPSDMKAKLKTTVCILNRERSLKINYSLVIAFPMTIFVLLFKVYAIPFLVMTILFYFMFLRNKNYEVRYYKLLETYATISYGLLLLPLIF
jgi:lycopene elongase/hydratase (dihydrobisanhydrobacterioruberin-forming)